ncbi:MAG: hypothetical protein IPL22_04015 [Bacteroidetes bacterium]|nr:hypothetical protein [Bacteroidota bacterium]
MLLEQDRLEIMMECSFSGRNRNIPCKNEQSNLLLCSGPAAGRAYESRIEVLSNRGYRLQFYMLYAPHPYEEIAFEISIDNQHQNVGSGMIGELPATLKSGSL